MARQRNLAQQLGGLAVAAAQLPDWVWWTIARHPAEPDVAKLTVYSDRNSVVFVANGYDLRNNGEVIADNLTLAETVQLLIDGAEKV